MSRQLPSNPGRAPAPQDGFTLLEVLVAMVLIGFGLSVAFTAVSGTARLDEKIALHDAAVKLARAKLDEALSSPDFQVAKDEQDERYAGVDFGYRIQLQPLELLNPVQQAKLPTYKAKLEQISIEVFWGPQGAQQSYRLTSYRLPSTAAPAPANPTSAARP